MRSEGILYYSLVLACTWHFPFGVCYNQQKISLLLGLFLEKHLTSRFDSWWNWVPVCEFAQWIIVLNACGLLLAVGVCWCDIPRNGSHHKRITLSAQVKCRENPAEWMFLPSSFQKLSSNLVLYFVNFLLEVLFLVLWLIFVPLPQKHDCVAFMAWALQVTCQQWLILSSIACASRIPTQFSRL